MKPSNNKSSRPILYLASGINIIIYAIYSICFNLKQLQQQITADISRVWGVNICCVGRGSRLYCSLPYLINVMRLNTSEQKKQMWRLYPVCILPHIIDTVHVDRSLPFFSLHEVVFRLREPRFSLQLLQTAHLSSPSLTITYVSHTGRLNHTTQPIKGRWIRARIECRGRINAPKFVTLWKKKSC